MNHEKKFTFEVGGASCDLLEVLKGGNRIKNPMHDINTFTLKM